MEILTQRGFRSFDGFIQQDLVNSLLRFSFEDGTSIECTSDHRFLCQNGKYKKSKDLSINDVLYPNKIISNIEEITTETPIPVYDALNVEDTHSFFTNGIVSHNCNVIALDEFAFVERAEEFFTSSYPVISSGKNSKVIIVSTPNGMGNVFHRIWTGAVTNTNEFKPFTIHWSHVPGRDERWKEETKRNVGERAWEQEYELSFLGSGNTLISGNTLLTLSAQEPIHSLDGGTIRIYRQPIKDHFYIMTVDVSRGRGQDHSTFNIIDISTAPFEQVCVFQNNNISPLLFPSKIFKYATLYNNAYVIIESNDNGIVVCNGLFYDLEYDNQFTEMRSGKTSIGVEMNRKIKAVGCSNLKDLIEENKLIIHDRQTVQELCMFVAKGNSYEAEQGNHDDLVMNLVMFAWFSSNNYFRSLTDIDIKNELYEEHLRQIEEELLPFGIIDDGLPSRFSNSSITNPYYAYHSNGNYW